MEKHKFTPDGLTATQWCSPQDKAKFLNDLARFVRSGFKETLFTKSLYTRLSMCFGHIAHYNKNGFYDVWFATESRQNAWKRYIQEQAIYGDPAWTFSDAERIFQKWLVCGEEFPAQTVFYTNGDIVFG